MLHKKIFVVTWMVLTLFVISLFPQLIVSLTLAETELPTNKEVSESSPDWWLWVLKNDKELYSLASCESGLNPQAIGHGDKKITGFESWGLFQYQPATFRAEVRKYKLLPNSEDQELMNSITDPNVQIKLTRLILADGGGKHWRTCYYQKYGNGSHRKNN